MPSLARGDSRSPHQAHEESRWSVVCHSRAGRAPCEGIDVGVQKEPPES